MSLYETDINGYDSELYCPDCGQNWDVCYCDEDYDDGEEDDDDYKWTW